MNGAQHYLEAEKLAANYKDAIVSAEEMPDTTMQQSEARMIACSNARSLLDKAQVHATLALAAATAEPIAQMLGTDPAPIAVAWSEAIS